MAKDYEDIKAVMQGHYPSEPARRLGNWSGLYMLEAVEVTAQQTIRTVQAIKAALMDYKHRIRDQHKVYNQDLINNLFTHPYTKIDFLLQDLGVSRLTATKYLDALAATGFVQKQKIGRSNYYVNLALNQILLEQHGE